MKITIENIKGNLRKRVADKIGALTKKGKIIMSLFAFCDVDHEYGWRSKGKNITIRYKEINSDTYHDLQIFYS